MIIKERYIKPRVEKIYPIKGRKDFFKFVVMEGDNIAKGMDGKEMYFDSEKTALSICSARKRVNKLNNEFLKK